MPQAKRYSRASVRVISNDEVAPDHYALTVAEAEMARETVPGQFFQVRLKGDGAPFLPRPFSIYDWHYDDRGSVAGFTMLYKVVGSGTSALALLKPGDSVAVTGPLGNGFTLPAPGRRTIIAAGGIGIAPFPALVRKAIEAGVDAGSFHLLYGARTADLIVEEKVFLDLGVTLEVATDDGTRGAHGTVIDLFERHGDMLAGDDVFVYASGPTPMLNAVAQFTRDRKIKCELSLEARMICGVGVCNSCAVAVKSDKAPDGWEYKLVCRDGPVFGASALYLK